MLSEAVLVLVLLLVIEFGSMNFQNYPSRFVRIVRNSYSEHEFEFENEHEFEN